VLRLSASSGEGGFDEEPIVRSELEIVNDDIEEAKATLVQYVKWLAESKVTHADVTEARQTYNLLLAERSRLKASSSAPSCATGVVRKHILREGGFVEWRVSFVWIPCNLNRV
jgi:hypothetical protein